MEEWVSARVGPPGSGALVQSSRWVAAAGATPTDASTFADVDKWFVFVIVELIVLVRC